MRDEKPYYVYLLANYSNTVIYCGVTNDLIRRVLEHRSGQVDSFTKKYKVWKLVYFEQGTDIYAAIEREKQIKAGSRAAKNALIDGMNPSWKDLLVELVDEHTISAGHQ